ncbi:type I-C CRISPR-associated protein Cas5c [Lactonifactor longoviformis]|uniref:type I-C CRISPR-associated protein Cas5c n=1 Tax=Lactonifactor longoviformis TaxID=341220 RepID=UPI0036F28A63
MRNQIEYCVSGNYALFSDPIARMGGEKFSYMLPTYQALKGITESIYWKPSIMWVVDEVRVIRPIRTESKNIRPISYIAPKNTLSVYTYLADVSYQVRAHFIFNENRREDLEQDFNEYKHHNISKRMVEKGGRRDVFLGTRECQGYVEPCTFGEGEGYYDGYGELEFGVMFHGFDYPDETGHDILAARFWRPKMVNGVVQFLPPEEIPDEMKREIRPMKAKKFGKELHNFSGLEENVLQQEFAGEGGGTNELDAEIM